MRKYITISLLLVSFVLVGALCGGKDIEEEISESMPFSGKQRIVQTDNKIRDLLPKVSGDGQTIVFWRDTDGDNYWDTLVLADPNGKEKGTIKVKGDVFTDKFGIMPESLDIDHKGNKVAFIGTPFVENWRSIDSMPSYFFTLDLGSKKAVKIDPHDLPELIYPPEVDAERAWPIMIKISPDGSRVAFTADVTGVEFGSRHDVPEDDIVGTANSDGSGIKALEMGINGACLAIDDSSRIFFARTVGEYGGKWNLAVVNASGKLESGKDLGLGINCPSRTALSVTKNGRRIAGRLASEGVVFVADDSGKIIAQGLKTYFFMITGEGSRLLGFESKRDLKPEERGLIYYDIDNNLEPEGQVLDMTHDIKGESMDVSYSGGVVVTEVYDNEGRDADIVTITWK